ncbi:ABC-2 transporter permease [Petrocella sp. FN5]|uniref:ABC-2 transporter permease n=1 Tax=Petrocella sp. FN5 TaxID=3032002 RepID=UPI0023DC20FA|nr:ABC-2 transporter permease [Petrocella sp. FN5]MDF1617133.1 ABC-2 transporter permease [Petrocella sp. FN5]
MIGLILRDLYINKKSLLAMLVMICINSVFLFNQIKNTGDFIVMLNAMSFVIIFMLCAMGEYVSVEKSNRNWKNFLYSSPLDVKTIVGQKYVLILIFISIGLIISMAYVFLMNSIMGFTLIFENVLGIIYSIVIVLLNSAGHKPLEYRYGEKRAMIFTTIFIVLIAIGMIVLFSTTKIRVSQLESMYNFLKGYTALLMLPFSLILFGISYAISVWIFNKYIE